MQNLEVLKALYPDLDINLDGGTDSYQENTVTVERDPIAVIIKHPQEDSYLIAQWKTSYWSGFLTGGIEDGDTLEQTVQKEVLEESGFKNISKVIPMNCVSHGLFFHTVKHVNRLAHYHLVFAELANLEKSEVSEKEKSIAEFVWVPENEVLQTLTRKDMKILWEFYMQNK